MKIYRYIASECNSSITRINMYETDKKLDLTLGCVAIILPKNHSATK